MAVGWWDSHHEAQKEAHPGDIMDGRGKSISSLAESSCDCCCCSVFSSWNDICRDFTIRTQLYLSHVTKVYVSLSIISSWHAKFLQNRKFFDHITYKRTVPIYPSLADANHSVNQKSSPDLFEADLVHEVLNGGGDGLALGQEVCHHFPLLQQSATPLQTLQNMILLTVWRRTKCPL